MTTGSRSKSARRALDARLASLGTPELFTAPAKGWVRAVRDALGMPASELGRRLGISQPSVSDLEQSERDGTARLDTLRRAADALDCTLVYVFLPRRGLEISVREQAERIVDADIEGVTQTMALEDQATPFTPEAREEAIERVMSSRGLWSRR